jgi:Domain of unknown function (DUF4139)/N-terminal domain of unknown function (DUF4140)
VRFHFSRIYMGCPTGGPFIFATVAAVRVKCNVSRQPDFARGRSAQAYVLQRTHLMARYLSALFFLTACPVYAETFVATAKITHVTVYPQGATIEREVTIDLPAGTHDLLIPGLSLIDVWQDSVRVAASDGVVVVSQWNSYGPVPQDATYPDLKNASDTVEANEAKLQSAEAGIAAIRVRIEAAHAKLKSLEAIASGDSLPPTPEERKAIVDMIAEETLIVLQSIHVGEVEMADASIAKDKLQKALDASLAYRDTLLGRAGKDKALALTLESKGGKATIRVSGFSYDAAWWPTYDVRLITAPVVSLGVDRSFMIVNKGEEDWRDVALTVSTSEVVPRYLQWETYSYGFGLARDPEVDEGAIFETERGSPVEPPDNVMLAEGLDGVVVEYIYPRNVTIGVAPSPLRLAIDHLDMKVNLFALAVDRGGYFNSFLMAKAKNDTSEPFLPGDTRLFRDGVLIGYDSTSLIRPGQEVEIALGPLPDMVATKQTAYKFRQKSEVPGFENGQSSTQTLRVENLTGRDWPLVVRGRVSYSEHDELKITYSATPPETIRDKDGQRGILEWQTDIAEGATFEVVLQDSMRWPKGMRLK